MKLKMTPLLSGQMTPRGFLRHFRRDEEGALIIFSIYMFILILWFGGMAVDLMRFETTRAKLQATLDRATLAAADLDQTLSPQAVVEDYFTKAGMLPFLESTQVDQGINFRVVSATASAKMPLFFYDLPRVFSTPFTPEMTSLTVRGGSTAEERVSDVEVSLVLDVSGSMDRNQRIENLRPAARDFVSTVLENNTNAPNGLITISMVPYSAVVNVGPAIEPYLPNLERTHNFSTCPLFPDDTMFETTELDLTENYSHVAHFDPDWYSDDAVPIANPWCHVDDHNAIVVASSNESILHGAITNLEPYGNTAIDMGMKWGVGLLDPSTRDLISGLAVQSGSNVPAAAAGRPQDFGQADVLKVVVLMTDGSNTQQYDLYEPYKSGLSYVWFNLDDPMEALHDVYRSRISVQVLGLDTPDYYQDDWFYIGSSYSTQRWKNHPDGYSSNWEYRQAMQDGPTIPADFENGIGPTYKNDVRNARWQELFASWEFNRVNNALLSRAYNHGYLPWNAGTDWAYSAVTGWYQFNKPDFIDADYSLNQNLVRSWEADDRLSDLCESARNEGIVIYTIAFEAPSAGRSALQDCASSPSHYFDVSGTDISAAFSAIASDIRALKLTQ